MIEYYEYDEYDDVDVTSEYEKDEDECSCSGQCMSCMDFSNADFM